MMSREIAAGNTLILHPEVLSDACLRRVSSHQDVLARFCGESFGPTHWADVIRYHMADRLSEADRAHVYQYADSELGQGRIDRVLDLMQGPSDPEDLEFEIPTAFRFATSLAMPDYRPSTLCSAQ